MTDAVIRRLAEEAGPGVFPEAFTKEGVMKEGWPKGAEKMVKNLDMLIEMDEPEAFVREALKLISAQTDVRWDPVKKGLIALEAELQFMNEPKKEK